MKHIKCPEERSLRNGIDHGEIATPITLFVPPMATAHLRPSSNAVKIVPCGSLEDAVYQTWPDLR